MQRMTKGERTKHHLYECALALFREKGYDNVSVDEIVKKAGTAKGTFYVHFSSKGDIISEMFREYDKKYIEFEEAVDPALPVCERLDQFIALSCRFTMDVIGVDMIRVLYLNQLVIGEIEQDALRQDRPLYRIIRGILAEGQENKTFRDDFEIDALVRWTIRCIRGSFYEWAMLEGSFDLTEETLRYIRSFYMGIKNDRN